jgi:lysophospholipase L1-like esterase
MRASPRPPSAAGTGRFGRRSVLAAMVACCLLAAGIGTIAAAGASSDGSSQGPPRAHDVATWGASADKVTGTLAEQTVRDVVHTSIGGFGLRISVSNAFGSQAITFGRVFVGEHDSGAAVVPGSNRQVTFGGSPSVTIPPGAEALSDPIQATFAPQQDLVVSLYLHGDGGALTGHNLATSTNYISTPGDHADDASGDAFTTTAAHWYWLDSVSVQEPDTVFALATLGDSITDGLRSTVDGNLRWPDDLARRILQTRPFVRRIGVMNEGISGNQLEADRAGVSAQARLDRDVLSKPGVRTVFLLEGINDIGIGTATSADQLIAAYRQIIARVHAAGKCIVGATMTPFKGTRAPYYTDAKEPIREAANDWIRTSGEFDGVVDFDKVTRDPADPHMFLPAYDSGDHLHPNDAGYQAMADAVPLKLVDCDR